MYKETREDLPDICETRSQCDMEVDFVNCACSSLLFVSYLLLAQLRGSGRARRRWATTIAAPSNRSVNCRSMMATVRSLFLQQTDRNIWNTTTFRARPCHCARGHVNMVLSSQPYSTTNIESRNCPDRPWCPPSLLYNGCRVIPGVKRPGRAVDHPPYLAPRLKKE
jgi:hypothetical protein